MNSQLRRDGYVIVKNAIDRDVIDDAKTQFLVACESQSGNSATIQNSRGANFAARNVLDWFPQSLTIWRTEKILQLLADTLGNGCGLVRGLYFDKPPSRSWALPWHKDMTIAVQQHRDFENGSPFCKPTTKAGVPHVEASHDLLKNMLTLRIHLDDVTLDNGPLKVVPGSHHSGKESTQETTLSPETILADVGDVLAIHPLVSHCSPESTVGCTAHRRILHLEFAADSSLPQQWQWKWFFPVFGDSLTALTTQR
ncbi:MAG: ectoine hydroxylase-related dioxygenase (phytanoyl-CoA dioxygenase family) [Pirellulaceae bacterium]